MAGKAQEKAWASKIVNYTLGIGQKENEAGIRRALSKYGTKAKRVLSKKSISAAEAKRQGTTRMLDAFCKVDYGPLAVKKGNKYVMKKRIGHSVILTCNEENREFARLVQEECWKNGAHTAFFTASAENARKKILLSPEDALMELPASTRAMYANNDYIVSIEPLGSAFWKKGIPPSKIMATSAPRQRLYEIRDRHQERWAYIGWPSKQIAKELKIAPAKFRRIVFNSIAESFKKRTYDLVHAYARTLRGARTIKIVSEEGTDLTFSTAGRRFLKDDGVLSAEDIANNDVGMNIPCGETFVAPVETSANGSLYIPKNIVHGYGVAKGIWLHFKKGEVVDYSAEKHEKYLDRFFDENTGDIRRIAELGIGCNRGAEFTNGYTIVDEKILGTIHIAIGWNVGYGGRNKASAHLDFIKPMESGQLLSGRRVVMDRGKLC